MSLTSVHCSHDGGQVLFRKPGKTGHFFGIGSSVKIEFTRLGVELRNQVLQGRLGQVVLSLQNPTGVGITKWKARSLRATQKDGCFNYVMVDCREKGLEKFFSGERHPCERFGFDPEAEYYAWETEPCEIDPRGQWPVGRRLRSKRPQDPAVDVDPIPGLEDNVGPIHGLEGFFPLCEDDPGGPAVDVSPIPDLSTTLFVPLTLPIPA